MKERPILFSAAMVRAILEARKTQTRRVMKPQPQLATDTDGQRFWLVDFESADRGYGWKQYDAPFWTHCPYGAPRDRLWVRETFATECSVEGNLPPWSDGRPVQRFPDGDWWQAHYRATDPTPDLDCCNKKHGDHGGPCPSPWRPSIFMPRWASRITLEITDIRVQRLQEITDDDAVAEGVTDAAGGAIGRDELPRLAFRHLWNSINEVRGFPWSANPWVWALTFRRVG